MSEFGTGYAYCLGLFLAHEWKLINDKERAKNLPEIYPYANMWFNGAADHLFELIAPSNLPASKIAEIEEFKDRCIGFRLNDNATFSDCDKAIEDAKRMLLEWDLFNDIKAEKGDWEKGVER